MNNAFQNERLAAANPQPIAGVGHADARMHGTGQLNPIAMLVPEIAMALAERYAILRNGEGGVSAGGHRSQGSGTSTSGLSEGLGGSCSGSRIQRGGILITIGSRGGSSGAFGG